MMVKKRLLFLAVFAFSLLPAIAEDDFSEGFGSFDEPPGTEVPAEGDKKESDSAEISITADTAVRIMPVPGVEDEDFFISPLEGLTNCKVNFNFRALESDFYLQLNLDDQAVEDALDAIGEAWFKLYKDKFVLQAGLIKTVWGKGDSFHVLDLLNAKDFSDFINSPDLDTKIPALMLKADFLLGMNSRIEFVYEPLKNRDTVPTNGLWVPYEVETMLDNAFSLLYYGSNGDNGLYAANYAVIYGGMYTSVYNQAYAAAIAAGADEATARAMAEAAASDPAVSAAAAEEAHRQASAQADAMIDGLLSSDTDTDIADAQFGLRFCDSLSGFDYGLQYYYGFEKQPRLPDLSGITSLDDIDLIEFIFPRIHVFGADAAFTFGSLNFRMEAAYTLMENRDLADSISYTAGFDFSTGLSNITINVQSYGSYKLKDVENGITNRFAVQISDKWKNETIEPSIQGVYNLEGQDFLIKARLDWSLSDELDMELAYTMFEGEEDTDFGQFDDNDFASIRFIYSK